MSGTAVSNVARSKTQSDFVESSMGTVNGGKSRVEAGVHVGSFGVAAGSHQVAGGILDVPQHGDLAVGYGGKDGGCLTHATRSLQVSGLVQSHRSLVLFNQSGVANAELLAGKEFILIAAQPFLCFIIFTNFKQRIKDVRAHDGQVEVSLFLAT